MLWLLFMDESINWLHLTDLHYGLDPHGWLWPQIKEELLRDVAQLASDIGGWDIVFFTGDLTQHGSKAEFDRLNKDLEEIWDVLAKSGSSPKLCLVPGNHDLERPSPEALVAKTMKGLWWSDEKLRRTFWTDAHSECRLAVDTFFKNYSYWAANLPVPSMHVTPGLLPGDFSATFEKGRWKLGILGLNSTFLQISDGAFEGKLDLHVSQLNAVCDGDPSKWLKSRTASVLLTHHPPSWLSPEALKHFREQIYPPGRFHSQLCGHQHNPESTEISEAGGGSRRLRQGPSLFGLENWQGPTPRKRIHGYTAGQFLFEPTGGIEKAWPRTAILGIHGGLNIAPDYRYKLERECIVSHFDISDDEAISESISPPASSSVGDGEPQAATEIKVSELQLLDGLPDEPTSRKRLASCPRFRQAVEPQHRQIRLEEQSQFELELRKGRCIWITADWGVGKDGFLISAIERFRADDLLPEVFLIKCDEADNVDALEALFTQQCGMPLQQFCTFLGVLKGGFLVLDGIDSAICKGEQLTRLSRITSAILDYCPELRLILLSRLLPEKGMFPSLELHPLEGPDVRTYLMHHPDATSELREADVVEQLHWHSDGLPMHLDQMLKALKVSSIAEVLEENMESASGTKMLAETAPKALIHAVSNLAKSQDRNSQRSFRLLKVLAVLPYGETLDALRHFLPVEPFFYGNALQLHDLALLEVVPLKQTLPKVGLAGRDDQDAPKLLKVPRQVRDYVQTLISEQERSEIVAAGAERFFGRKWRESSIKLRKLPAEYREYLSNGVGNEHALIHQLIAQGRRASDDKTVRRSAQLGIYYCRHLSRADRFRDVAIVAGGLVQAIDRDEHPDQWCELASIYGEALRMTDKEEESLTYSRAALEVGESRFTKKVKASIWLTIGLSEGHLDNEDAAVQAAEKVKEYSQPVDPNYFSALALIAQITLTEPQRQRELVKIQRVAREKGYNTIANNIAFELAKGCESSSERIKHFDTVLETSKQGSYTFFRGIVDKASAVQNHDSAMELRGQEVFQLTAAYSYFHAQRFSGLFDRCHAALWKVFESNNNQASLLRLFRHSSFVWRIRGNEAAEKEYLERLKDRDIKPNDSNGLKTFVLEMSYYMRRLKIVLVEIIKAKGDKP